MTCEECEALLIDEASSGQPQTGGELGEHLRACSRCRSFAEAALEAVALATLSPLSETELAQLSRLASGTLQAQRKNQRPRGRARRFLGWAVAAGLGALVASGTLLALRRPFSLDGLGMNGRSPLAEVSAEPSSDEQWDSVAAEVGWEPDSFEEEGVAP